MLKRIESAFPGVLKGNEQSSEKDMLFFLVYELIHIYECYVDRLHADGNARSQDEIDEFRMYFVGTVLFHYGINERQSKPLALIPENLNLPKPKTSENRLVGMIQTAYKQYQKNLKASQQNCQPPA